MKKKFYLILLLLLPLCAAAQGSTGSWTLHTRFMPATARNIIDTEKAVYYLLGNDLFCFDKTSHATTSVDKTNDLSDVLATGIYYNYDKNYLVITYEDANIDVFTANGDQYNIPNIKEAMIEYNKGINHVTFADGKFYVATQFGYVVVNDATFTVSEYHNYGKSLLSVEELGDQLLLIDASLYYLAPLNAPHETLANFKSRTNSTAGKTTAISPTRFFQNVTGKGLYVVDVTLGSTPAFTATQVVATAADNVQKTATGFLANFMSSKYYYTFDANGDNATKKTCSDTEMFSSNPKGDGTMWSINTNGLHSSAAAATYYKLDGILITSTPWWMAYNKSEHKMYVGSTADNGILMGLTKGKYEMNAYDGSTWTDITPTALPATSSTDYGWYWPEFNPNDSSMYFISCRMGNGILRVQNGAVTGRFGVAAPMVARKGALRFDKDGNLWIVHSSKSSSVVNETPVKVLSKDKLANATFSASDYTVYKVPNVTDRNSFKWSTFAISKGTDIKVFTCGDLAPLVIWDNYGQITDGTNFRSKTFKDLQSRTNKIINWDYTYDMKADNFGYVWMGNNSTLVRFNPAEAFNDDFRVDDISELVGNSWVSSIAFDKDNNVWVATYGEGIYVLNQDGTEVLATYNTANSPLPSNSIYTLCYDPDHESMFIITPTCIMEYSESIKGGDTTYDNVYAYPNPVRPDFTGYVSIKRLIPGSNVKITDAAGNVVCETRDVAGTATWDACNSNGERVPTGTYYVYASTGATVPTTNPVAKIMVIK